jgi:FAD/FMN-containing dehydrogenase
MAEVQLKTIDGDTKSLGGAQVTRFQSLLRGELLQPADRGYDAARRVWNAMVDKRPALIARCAGPSDVIQTVRFAREHDLLVSVRGGGHNYAGVSVWEGGLMIDLSPMRGIRVDPFGQKARAQAGLRLGEFDRETQAFGLATTLGINTDTGIAGLTLGGGYGWLAGKHGLACDNLLSVDIVTADGQLLTANDQNHADLFWAVRGAGANFGIVTSFEYQLHTIGPIVGGMLLHPLSKAGEVLRFHHEYSSTAPDTVTTTGALLCAPDGSPMVASVVCYAGALEASEKVLLPLRTFCTPLADLISTQPYLQMQALFDQAWVPGRYYYNKSHILSGLSDEAIATLSAHARTMPTPLSVIALQQLHGVASRMPKSATAFPHRYNHYSIYIHPASDQSSDCERMKQWAREGWEALRPFADNAVYVNAIEDMKEEGEARIRAAFGPSYDRLAALKNKYDPTNFFRLNNNIIPAVNSAASS